MKGDVKEVHFVSGGEELLESIRPLWLKLRVHVVATSTNFPKEMSRLTWEERKKEILGTGQDSKAFVDLAFDADDILIGYCVSTISERLEGEIDSIFVERDWRGNGLGRQLMERAERWLDSSGARNKKLVVTWGNENVLGFYSACGYLPSRIELEKKKV